MYTPPRIRFKWITLHFEAGWCAAWVAATAHTWCGRAGWQLRSGVTWGWPLVVTEAPTASGLCVYSDPHEADPGRCIHEHF